jgi:hypothetical protein
MNERFLSRLSASEVETIGAAFGRVRKAAR